MRVHMVIPDCQVKHGVPTQHLEWIGKYIVEYKPDVIVNIGDFADMPSLSSYDKGKKCFEGRRYNLDILSAKEGMAKLLKPMKDHNKNLAKTKHKQYKPEMHLTLGNHEHRINRVIESDPMLDGIMGVSNLCYEKDWIVHEFLNPVTIDGVTYAHYFYNPMNGRPYGGMIESMLKTIGFTFTMGHQQGLRMGMRTLNNGQMIRGLVAGSCYLHEENYIGYQGNDHWQGVIIKHEVEDGNYCIMEISLDYLCRKYEQMRLSKFMEAIK